MILAMALLTAQAAGPVWIESENFSSANVKPGTGYPGRPELLSNGKWLSVSGDVPAEGVLLSYAFSAPAGHREIWHRLGYEGARSPFDWRVDGGEWKRVGPDAKTTDLTELAEWNQVAWLDMGAVELSGADHKLEIRIPKPAKDGVLYGSDAFAFVDGPFHPYGKWKPGENPRTDRDLAAAEHVFSVPEQPGPARSTVKLDGDWEIARDAELSPDLVAKPMSVIDANPVWTAITVPGDKAEKRPDLALAHRVWYRTRISVPASQIGRKFFLTFRQNSLNTTVRVNGVLCGFNKNPFVNWSTDVSAAVHPGVNEVMVGIKDAWYGFHQDPQNPGTLRNDFAIPSTRERQGFLKLDYPVWGCFKSGLLVTPELTVAGSAYAADVFVRPSVAKGRLEADVTLRGDGPVSVTTQAVDPDSGKVVKSLASTDVDLKGEQTVTVGGAWSDPTLWWPDRPKMYVLRTLVTQNGKTVDQSDTPFGFREWTVDGPRYLLNGVVWHGWAELTQGAKPDEWLTNYRQTGQRFQRISGPSQNGSSVYWMGMPYDEALDWCDTHGVTIRRCGPLDGEAIGYMAIDDQGGINHPLLQNVRDQIVAQVKGERNHPSVNMWSVENEWLYINCINLYGGQMDDFERDMAGTIAAVRAVDPTRLAMTDGGGSGKDHILPVHGDHYVYTNDPNDYPTLAYTAQPNGASRGRWTYDGKRPRYAGEDYFASGINAADYAWIQGESAFESKVSAQKGMAQVQRMITEGYRWSGGFTAFHLWIGNEGAEYHDKYVANAERAIFVRQYDTAFVGGQKVTRTLGVFNDSRFDDPLTVQWSLVVDGKSVFSGAQTLTVAPGTHSTFDLSVPMPQVATKSKGALVLDLRTGGKNLFHDSKPLSIFPATRPKPEPSAASVELYDPSGTVARYLSAQGIAFHPIRSLAAVNRKAKTLLIGPDALTDRESSDPMLAAAAFDGQRVLVLEQTHPLRGAGLPTDLEPATGGGAFAFAEDSGNPVVRGLEDADFHAWGKAERTYEQPYVKATRGVRSLVQVGPRLGQTALCEIPVGKGTLLLCQLQVGHNLASGGAARRLLSNLIDYAATYQRVEKPVRAKVDDPELTTALDGMGVRRNDVADPLATLTGNGIAIVSATPTNLAKLASNLPKVRQFTNSGGSLVLNGLTPEGLADYNKIVGVEHMIRPFRRERTALFIPRDPLAAGVTQGDVVLSSGERMFDFNEDTFAAEDTFRYVVDVNDVAPFAQLPSDYLYNSVNGFVSADSWKYILSLELKNGKPEYTMAFPRKLPFREMTWIGNAFYHKVTKIGLSFDGGPVVEFKVQPNNDPQRLTIAPVQTAKTIKLSILDWTKDPGVGEVVGIDNLYLQAVRPSDWNAKVHPLLNVGGLVRYPQGKGSIVLANLNFKKRETVPENALKKRAVFASILRNLGAGFAGGANVVVPGSTGVTYAPIGLAGKANVFRNKIGLAQVPSGRQVFGSVPFQVYEFPTSPVPDAVAASPGQRTDGIKVDAKANALFFLQSATVDQPRNEGERRENKRIELGRYVVHYADGTEAIVPVNLEIDVDDYRLRAPRDLANARVVWSKAGLSGGDSASLYLMQWTNPKPDVAITSISLESAASSRGTVVLIAATAAR